LNQCTWSASTRVTFEQPPLVRNAAGHIRTIGLEIEFGGLPGSRAAELVRAHFGGVVIEEDPNAWRIEGTTLGDFAVELDIWFAHPEPRGEAGEVQLVFAQLIGQIAAIAIPYEIITPPIPFDRLGEIDAFLDRLRTEGASGTEGNLIHAFGLHLNPEVPNLEAATITAILKAYALLSPWLWREVNPDPTRRLLGFAEPFDHDYVSRLVDPRYWPETLSLIDDYIDANPTRWRDLDCLPLFAWLDEPRVRSRLPKAKLHRRPTFHYRLPDSRVSEAGWSFAPDWNRWVAVERLAADRNRLDEVCRYYLDHFSDREQWADIVAGLTAR
jgi:hypothetical protein